MTASQLTVEDELYALVPTQEWNGHVRLASVTAEAMLEFLDVEQDLATRTLRLIVRSIVDQHNNRVPFEAIDQAVAKLGQRSWQVVERIKRVVFDLNGLTEDRTDIRIRLESNHLRCFAHKLAAERGWVNVDAMLRSITWQQFQELLAYHEIESHGEQRDDLRFAILASVIAGSAGAKMANGQSYTAKHFFESLHPTARAAQTPKQIEQHLMDWMNTANVIHAESGGRA